MKLVEIRPFVGAVATDAELRQWHELSVADGAATYPGMPTKPFPALVMSLRNPRYVDLGPRHAWAAWGDGRLLGFGTVAYPDRGMVGWAFPRVVVDSAHRRCGIGTGLLRAIVADARAQGSVTLANDQIRLGSDGDLWARAAGFVNVLSSRWQMLHVADADPRLWDVSPPIGFRVEQWAGAAPETLVAAFAAARNAISDAPNGESSYREPEWTIDRVRQAEAERREAGDDVRYVVAVHEETGDVVALTGMLVRPGYSDLCWQRDTAVVGSYRGLGLGRAVKAAMMRWLLAEIPGLGRVVTSNAAGNAHMIRVNEQLGYKHYADIGRFEGSVEQVDAAIGTSSKTNIPRPRHEAADEELAA